YRHPADRPPHRARAARCARHHPAPACPETAPHPPGIRMSVIAPADHTRDNDAGKGRWPTIRPGTMLTHRHVITRTRISDEHIPPVRHGALAVHLRESRRAESE